MPVMPTTSARPNCSDPPLKTPSYKDERFAMQVIVRDNNVEQALKVLKKKMQREGVFREMKQRRHYEKPSEKRVREKAEAISRARKAARKAASREAGIKPIQRKPGEARPAPAAI